MFRSFISFSSSSSFFFSSLPWVKFNNIVLMKNKTLRGNLSLNCFRSPRSFRWEMDPRNWPTKIGRNRVTRCSYSTGLTRIPEYLVFPFDFRWNCCVHAIREREREIKKWEWRQRLEMERLEMRRTRGYYEETPTKSVRPRSSRIQAPRIPCFAIRVPCVYLFETDSGENRYPISSDDDR